GRQGRRVRHLAGGDGDMPGQGVEVAAQPEQAVRHFEAAAAAVHSADNPRHGGVVVPVPDEGHAVAGLDVLDAGDLDGAHQNVTAAHTRAPTTAAVPSMNTSR